MKCLIR